MKEISVQDIAKKHNPKRPLLKNCLFSFVFGGFICGLGQVISHLYMTFFNFKENEVGDPTVATLIIITMVLTGFGVYDKIAQYAGAGTIVPVTGFGNAMISSAIEYKSEGYVIGMGGHMFKLAGSVIVSGVFSSFVVALIKTLLT